MSIISSVNKRDIDKFPDHSEQLNIATLQNEEQIQNQISSETLTKDPSYNIPTEAPTNYNC